mgnify:CR=1 FL=1
MKIRYLYIDDELKSSVAPFTEAVEEFGQIAIEHIAPLPYEDQIQDIIQRQRAGEFDGLILDLRLDKIANWNPKDKVNKAVNYRGATLAQEIRTRTTEGPDSGLSPFPIVLWSTEDYLEESYWRDNTSHDLFDLRVVKQHIQQIENFASRLSGQLVDLVKGYNIISSFSEEKSTRPFELLNIDVFELLDMAIAGHLVDSIFAKPVHEQARFILRQLLETPNNSLINDEILAARLGLDINRSPDFSKLVDSLFAKARYKGPFSDGWPCWWFSEIEDIWESVLQADDSLREMTASERVELLKQRSSLTELIAATPPLFAKSTSYWTICKATRKPIDITDGFKIRRQPSHPWQNPFYVSLEGVIEGFAEEKNIKISPLDEQRYEHAKAQAIASNRGKQTL